MDWTDYEVEGQMDIFDYIEKEEKEFDLSRHMNKPIEGADMREELEKRLAELEEKEFDLKMKDTWTNGDSQRMSQINKEMNEIREKLNAIEA